MFTTILLESNVTAAIVGGISGIIGAIISLVTKRFIETSILSSKLKTEHNFEQRKKIMEVLSKYKVQLLNACEDLGHRLNNFDGNKNYKDMKKGGNYKKPEYYFHSFAYRIICVFGWIRKIENEMIFLDTTLASSRDLDFLKFLRLFPRVFCNISVVEAKETKDKREDSFTRHTFEVLSASILTDTGVKSYTEFVNDLPDLQAELGFLFEFLDGITPREDRRRWHRLKLLHALLIVFLNTYGYDFQKSDNEKIRKMLCRPFPSLYTKNYPRFFRKYHLDTCLEVQQFLTLAGEFHQVPIIATLPVPESYSPINSPVTALEPAPVQANGLPLAADRAGAPEPGRGPTSS
jgi:hypothetical protein